MIAGSADVLAFDHARGWAADLDNPAEKLTIRVMDGDRELARCIAAMPRSDLVQFGDDGKMAFEISFPLVKDTENLAVYADGKAGSQLLNVVKKYPYKQGYQTFEDQVGDSNSQEKLQMLGLPERLDGLSVLDLGCNEGFFCIKALERGAARVTGIDASAEYIAKARQRNSEANYIQGSWWDIPNEKYDLILFLSAMHYEPNPQGLFDKIANHLKPGGRLILECGMMNTYENLVRLNVPRGDGVFNYPSRTYLINCLLRRYYVRYHGASIGQEGDAVERHVVHACLREPMVIFLPGEICSGKTIMASLLENHKNVINFGIDLWLCQIKYTTLPVPQNNEIYNLIRNKSSCTEIDAFIESLDSRQATLFADAVFAALPLQADCIIIEGYALSRKEIFARLKTLLEQAGVRVWQLERI